MNRLQKLWNKPAVKGAVVVTAVFIFALAIRANNVEEGNDEQLQARSVEVTTAAEVAGGQQITLIGTVRAFTEAEITTERAGRVTSVNTSLGSTVGAGQVIATLENASEQAAVLQAQGAYEAALAAAAQTGIGVDEAGVQVDVAEDSLKNAIRSTYNTANNVVRTNIDTFYSTPESSVPGLRLSGQGQTAFLNNERVAYQTLLPQWQQRANSVSTATDLATEADYAQAQLDRTISLLDTFLTVLASQPRNEPYSEAELDGFISTFTSLRASLLSSSAAIDNAEAQLRSAREAERRATVSASGGSASAADAQVKQALGSLRAAQANLAKTVLRTPIGGQVNSLDVKIGDFVGSFEQVAIVANNAALEIVTFVGDNERDQLIVGDEVLIDGKATGVITTIAPGIDSATRKTEVRVATDDESISNGDTVRITKATESEQRVSRVLIPLTAVKFEATDGFIMQVNENDTVTQKAVTLGPVLGNRVEVTSGLEINESFISDVRGLTPGTIVSVRD